TSDTLPAPEDAFCMLVTANVAMPPFTDHSPKQVRPSTVISEDRAALSPLLATRVTAPASSVVNSAFSGAEISKEPLSNSSEMDSETWLTVVADSLEEPAGASAPAGDTASAVAMQKPAMATVEVRAILMRAQVSDIVVASVNLWPDQFV